MLPNFGCDCVLGDVFHSDIYFNTHKGPLTQVLLKVKMGRGRAGPHSWQGRLYLCVFDVVGCFQIQIQNQEMLPVLTGDPFHLGKTDSTCWRRLWIPAAVVFGLWPALVIVPHFPPGPSSTYLFPLRAIFLRWGFKLRLSFDLRCSDLRIKIHPFSA